MEGCGAPETELWHLVNDLSELRTQNSERNNGTTELRLSDEGTTERNEQNGNNLFNRSSIVAPEPFGGCCSPFVLRLHRSPFSVPFLVLSSWFFVPKGAVHA